MTDSAAPIRANNNFNLLRFLFASLVIVSHCPEIRDGDRSHELLSRVFGTLSFGDLAVDSFFLLSGFLIVKSWNQKPSAVVFLRSRILRIFPAFIVASILCAVLFAPVGAASDYFQKFDIVLFVRGLVVLAPPRIPAAFEGTYYPYVNASMYTIRLEFYCYWMVLVFGIVGGFRRRPVWAVLSLLLIVLYFVSRNIQGGWSHNDDLLQKIRFGMIFAVGGCYYLYGQGALNKPYMMLLAAAAVFVLMFNSKVAEFAVSVFWGYLILSVAVKKGGILSGFNKLPDVSYGVYLYAWPLTKIILFYDPDFGRWALTAVVWMLSIVFGTASWYLIEKPIMSRLSRPQRKTTPG